MDFTTNIYSHTPNLEAGHYKNFKVSRPVLNMYSKCLQCATESDTVVGHRKGSGISKNPSVFVWALCLVGVGVYGGAVLCGCGGDLEI